MFVLMQIISCALVGVVLKMKKLTMILMIGILLVGFVVAGVTLDKIYKDKEVSKEDNALLDSVNMNEMNISELQCGTDTCNPITFTTNYGSMTEVLTPYWMNCSLYNYEEDSPNECLEWTKILYTDAELSAQIDKIADEYLKRILKRIKINKENKDEVKVAKVGEKEITITKKKL